jgi:uncharacterized protein (TIGR03382 family)
MLSRRLAAPLAAAVALAALAAPALAEDSVFTFTYSDPITLATGSVLASDNGDGSFTAYSGTLTITGTTFDGVYSLWENPTAPAPAYSPTGMFIIDNQVFPGTSSMIDWYGLLFTDGLREVNLWGNGEGNPWSLWSSAGSSYDYSSDAGTVEYTQGPAVPAPGALALAGTGMLLVVRRRK